MLNLTVAVILHGITLTGNLGSIDSTSCPIAAKSLSGDNWNVTCTENPDITAYPNWTDSKTFYNVYRYPSCHLESPSGLLKCQ